MSSTSHLPPASSTSTVPSPNAHKLTSSMLTQFGVGRKHNSSGCINTIDFSSKGDSLVASTDEPDESIQLFNVTTAQPKKSVYCKKSGCDLVRFTHHTNTVLVASKNKGEWDDSIRYLSLHDNKYLRYFRGHRDRVCGLSMSPLDDSFLSASHDRTVRHWDLRTNICQGLMNLPPPNTTKSSNPGKILVSHDPAGMVFAVACSPNIIKLFDSRSTSTGPFVTFDINVTRPGANGISSTPASSSSSAAAASNSFFSWSSLKFSPDGKDLLVSTTESIDWPGSTESTAGQNFTNQILLIDSYEGSQKQAYTGHEFNPNTSSAQGAHAGANSNSSASHWSTLPFEASFSPDGAFVFAGSRSGAIYSWNTTSGDPVAVWSGLHSNAPITAVQFCPTKMLLVSADANGQMLWWTPTQSAIAASTAAAAAANTGSAPMNTSQ